MELKKCFMMGGLIFLISMPGYGQCNFFYDGFETGSYLPDWSAGAGVTMEVTDSNSAVGDYCLRTTGIYPGTGADLYPAPIAASELSWWIYPDNHTVSNAPSCRLVCGNLVMTPFMGIIFTTMVIDSSFYVKGDSILLTYPIVLDTWYHIEIKNINWTAHTYDVYINGTLEGADFLFDDPSLNDITRISLTSHLNVLSTWDEISIGPPAIRIDFNTTGPTTCGGNNGAIDASITNGMPGYTYSWSNGANTEDLALVPSGNYTLIVTDSTGCRDTATAVLNDPSAPAVTLDIPEDTVCANAAAFALSGASIPGGTYSGTGVSANIFTPSVAGPGAQTITYTYTAANNCTGTAEDQLVVNACMGVEDEEWMTINIYPNPASSFIFIEPSAELQNSRLLLLNPMGQVMQEQQMTGGNMMFNIETYPAGVYFLQCNKGEKQVTKKIIVQ